MFFLLDHVLEIVLPTEAFADLRIAADARLERLPWLGRGARGVFPFLISGGARGLREII
jgi:hypothetical protein